VVSEWACTGAGWQDVVSADADARDEHGRRWLIPMFVDGSRNWKLRFSSTEQGLFSIDMRGRNSNGAGCAGCEAVLEVIAGESSNPLLNHGPVRSAFWMLMLSGAAGHSSARKACGR
jgi:hypothetical protein